MAAEPAWPFDRKKKQPKSSLLEDDKALLEYVKTVMARPYMAIHYAHLERFLFLTTGKEWIIPDSGPNGIYEIKGTSLEKDMPEHIKSLQHKLYLDEMALDSDEYMRYIGVIY